MENLSNFFDDIYIYRTDTVDDITHHLEIDSLL